MPQRQKEIGYINALQIFYISGFIPFYFFLWNYWEYSIFNYSPSTWQHIIWRIAYDLSYASAALTIHFDTVILQINL